LICKASGHDIATCKRHYERLSLKEKRKELTKDMKTPSSLAGIKNGDFEQDALDFSPSLSDEVVQRNKLRHEKRDQDNRPD
jgi:hypothetical protein